MTIDDSQAPTTVDDSEHPTTVDDLQNTKNHVTYTFHSATSK